MRLAMYVGTVSWVEEVRIHAGRAGRSWSRESSFGVGYSCFRLRAPTPELGVPGRTLLRRVVALLHALDRCLVDQDRREGVQRDDRDVVRDQLRGLLVELRPLGRIQLDVAGGDQLVHGLVAVELVVLAAEVLRRVDALVDRVES